MTSRSTLVVVATSAVFSVRLDQATTEWLEHEARRRGVGVTTCARDLIIEGLARAGQVPEDPQVSYSNGRSLMATGQKMMDAAIEALAGKEDEDD